MSHRRSAGGWVPPSAATSGTSAPPARRCVTADIDLDRLAAGYAHRPATAAERQRAATTAAWAQLGPGRHAVDVGGGPGHHAEVFAVTGAAAIVVDPARAMVVRAQAAGLSTIVARAEALPLADGSVHLVYFHLSLHLTDPSRAIAEAARVTASGGLVAVWTLDAEHHRGSLLARWFPSVAEIDAARFPDPADIAARMQDAGMEQIGFHEDTEARSRPAGEWIDAVEGGFVSTLQLVDDDELRRGVSEFRAAHPDPRQTIDYRLAYTGITARKRSLP